MLRRKTDKIPLKILIRVLDKKPLITSPIQHGVVALMPNTTKTVLLIQKLEKHKCQTFRHKDFLMES